eukprot:m.48074 g.48074  ORF g.48074 m.48074 type:complete len:266 (-) comp6015_c0_seq2:80-877(-)
MVVVVTAGMQKFVLVPEEDVGSPSVVGPTRPHCPGYTMLSLAVLLAVASAGAQKIAPLVPEEYVANVVQKKWNMNGFLVNNTYTGMWYHSVQNKAIRSDGVASTVENATSPLADIAVPMVQISLLDFAVDPPQNTYWEHDTLAGPSSCCLGNVTGFFLMPRDFLRRGNAIFAGAEHMPGIGWCDRWTLFIGDATVVTFFFNGAGTVVRWDLVSPGLQTDVQTYFSNLREVAIPPTIFAGRGRCPASDPCPTAGAPRARPPIHQTV